MRIFDKFDNVMTTYDDTKGYLKNDSLFICHHDAVEAIEEQGHFEVIAEYPNGGKDVEWIVDVSAVEAKEAWDEYEDILRFVEFDSKDLITIKIEELKKKLADTDYNIIKVMEGAATLDEMTDVIANRALWRKEINELEKELG